MAAENVVNLLNKRRLGRKMTKMEQTYLDKSHPSKRQVIKLFTSEPRDVDGEREFVKQVLLPVIYDEEESPPITEESLQLIPRQLDYYRDFLSKKAFKRLTQTYSNVIRDVRQNLTGNGLPSQGTARQQILSLARHRSLQNSLYTPMLHDKIIGSARRKVDIEELKEIAILAREASKTTQQAKRKYLSRAFEVSKLQKSPQSKDYLLRVFNSTK